MELNVSRITIFKRLGAMEILSEKNWKSATENPKITPSIRNRVEARNGTNTIFENYNYINYINYYNFLSKIHNYIKLYI